MAFIDETGITVALPAVQKSLGRVWRMSFASARLLIRFVGTT